MKTTNFGVRLLLEDSPCVVTPLSGRSYIFKLIEAVALVKFSLDVIQYQWNFYTGKPELDIQKLNRTVIAKAQSGIKIRVVLPKEGRDSHLTTINMGASKYLTEAGALVKFGYTFPIVHSKLWIFDNETVILGSHNLSSRSVTVNWETSIMVKSPAVALEYRRYFDSLWAIC